MDYQEEEEEEEKEPRYILWDSLLGDSNCATYDGSVDLDVLRIMRRIDAEGNESRFYTQIAKELSLTPNYVQLVQFLICGADLAEYGTSPRGCWLTDKGKALLNKLYPYLEELEK